MCGRIFQTLPLHRLIAISRASTLANAPSYSTSYNVCPTNYIPAIRHHTRFRSEPVPQQAEPVERQPEKNEPGQHPKTETEKIQENALAAGEPDRQLMFMKWGHKTKFANIINGRIEEMMMKRTFIDMINNRCVVIMQGYYEWNDKKEPYCFKSKDSDHLLVAAVYSEVQKQVIILTKDATPELAKVHHRMPVILEPEDVEAWLNPNNTKKINQIINSSLLKKDKAVWKNVGFSRVAPYVSEIKEKGPKCLMSFEDYKKELDKTGIMSFFKKKVQRIDGEGNVVQGTPDVKHTFVIEKTKKDILGVEEPKDPKNEQKQDQKQDQGKQ